MVKRAAAASLLLLLGVVQPSLLGSDSDPPDRKRDKEAERIEEVVRGVLDAYRAADYELMARYYAPEVTMVSFRYESALTGWANVRRAYLAQETGLKYVELAREETLIERRGKFAWVYYRWSFVGKVNDQYVTTLGHTTLVLEKRGRNWLIVHNHTSAAVPPTSPPQRPATPPTLPD